MKSDSRTMFVSGVLPILLCCVVKLSVARRNGAEDGETVEKINSARCTSRCLTLHITQLTSAFRRLQSDEVLGWCENHRRCAQCLQPCKELWETKRVLSHKFCEKHHECVTSAEFLQSLQTQKQGDCPSPQRASGFAAACVESCNADRECSGSKKCCSNGCGHTCQAPTNLYKGVPLKPRKDMAFLEDPHGQLEVTWMSKFNVSIEPVLYILQRRWNHGIHPSEDDASPWHTVMMTMEERALLKDVRPHRWYQFRVSAVNSQGTRGFTTPSKHFFSARDPFPPERPQNISAENQTVSADGRVSVLLRWDPPREGDLQLHHYKVTWSGPSGKESSRVADGMLTEMELGGLQPDTQYIVNIQAVAFWGQKRLKSNRAQLSFKTAASTGSSPTSRDFSNELPISRSSPRVLRLEAAAPHYHNNQLQVKVFWKSRLPENQRGSTSYFLSWFPEVCANNVTKKEKTATVQGTHYVITDLLFACKYKVTVIPLSEHEEKAGAVTSVTTPQCSTLKGRGKKLLSCAHDERHLQAKKALQRPEKLLAEFQTVNGTLEGLFSWQVSEITPGQTPITGFQFSWVKVSSSRVNKSPDSLISQTLNLAADQRSVRVEQLQPKCAYKVQVQALSEAGSGPSVAKMLNTPQLNGTLL
ncbi:anosmin-1b [Ictalurus punctatus]|uniref:Anosmin-1 n=1 Tax=Ictalurus punctatus TaxID=7998 RepID=W5U7I3_ICTPU|nr:anosmin-1b [Ictalurus punctatus]